MFKVNKVNCEQVNILLAGLFIGKPKTINITLMKKTTGTFLLLRVSKHFLKKVFIVKDKVSFLAKVFMDLFALFCIFSFFLFYKKTHGNL